MRLGKLKPRERADSIGGEARDGSECQDNYEPVSFHLRPIEYLSNETPNPAVYIDGLLTLPLNSLKRSGKSVLHPSHIG